MWTGQYPDGPIREYALSIGDIEPTTSAEGVRARLQNLGYNPGDTEESLRRAIQAFQRERGVEPTGETDQATLSALEERHGH